jgi:hypothetical protein
MSQGGEENQEMVERRSWYWSMVEQLSYLTARDAISLTPDAA